MNFFKAFPNEKRLPGLQRLYGGRWAMTRLLTLDGTEVDGGVLAANGTPFAFDASESEILQMTAAGVTPEDFHLFDLTTGGDGAEVAVLYKYETLTDTLVNEVAPVIDHDLNGLRRLTLKLIAKPGTSIANYVIRISSIESEAAVTAGAFVVGRRYKIVSVGTTDFMAIGASANTPGVVFVATGTGSGTGTARYPTLYLGTLRDESTDAATKVTLVYLEPGVLSKGKAGGPSSLPGTIRHTWKVWYMTAASAGMPGTIIDEDDENVNGFPVRVFTSITAGATNAVTSLSTTYTLSMDVPLPGVVSVATEAYSGNGSGDIPYLVQTAPRKERKDVSVTVTVVTTPPTGTTFVREIEKLSVGVVERVVTTNFVGTEVGDSVTTSVFADRVSVNQQTLRGYYYTNAGSTSGTSYDYTYPSRLNEDGDSIIGEAFWDTISRRITLSGDAAGPSLTGIVQREVDPIMSGLDGTQYYRVTTFTIPT